jgi:hypothetical protein
MTSMLIPATLWIGVILLACPSAPDLQDDAFIEGYATAILDREFALHGVHVEAKDGVLTVETSELEGREKDKVVAALSRIKGVREVRIVPVPPESAEPPQITGGGWQVFPEARVVPPFLADPRTPHFSLTYQRYTRSDFPKLRDVGAISLGEEFNVVQYGSSGFGRVNLGIEPAIFAIFNLDAFSHDLVNADYRIGLPLEYRGGPFQLKITPFHQSSHLGDEFLLDTPTERINLSYETIDVKTAIDVGDFRFYAGGSRRIHRDPSDLKLWGAQQGAEWLSTAAFLGDAVAPLVAVDIQEREETGWKASVSVRAGVELVNPELTRRRVQFLLEYYRGYNPNGQFLFERADWFGIGLHVYF